MKGRIAAACLAGLAAWSGVTHPWGWLYAIGVHPYPESSSTPWTYQLLSGFVPALTVLGLLTFVAGAWHHVNCHAAGCWRLGKHKIDGTPWCSRHHETARQVHEDRTGTTADLIVRLDRIIELLEDWPHGNAQAPPPGTVGDPGSAGS